MFDDDLALLRREPFLLGGLAAAADLCMLVGDAAAERHLQRAIAAAEAMPSVTYTGVGCLSYASMLVATGRPDARPRASALVQRSYALARSGGLRGIADLCRELATRTKVAALDAPQALT